MSRPAQLLLASVLAALVIGVPRMALAQFSVPIRWCVVANDTNGNGQFDAGEEGAPAFTDPGGVGEDQMDMVLWRRHERPSDSTYIPQADITLRSAIWNIAEDTTLNFPIIPDQDTSDPDHEVGDILDHRIDSTEYQATVNACIDAWRDDHGVEDIGIVAINARKIVDENGDEAFFAWSFGQSARRIYLEDNAWSYCDSDNQTSSVCDGVDKTFGHEVGHAFGLSHTCDNSNLMRQGRRDTDGDDVLDNFLLSDNIDEVTNTGADDVTCTADDTVANVDQIDESQDAAQDVPGCKIAGTNTDCSVQSDYATDALNDVAVPFLDIARVRITELQPTDSTELVHDLFGAFTLAEMNEFDELEYFFALDLDDDASTGGAPADLGVPTAFEGAELVTRVRVFPVVIPGRPSPDLLASLPSFVAPAPQPLQGPPVLALSASPTVWRFEGGAFAEVADPSIQARVEPVIGSGDAAEPLADFHSNDLVIIEMSSDVRGVSSFPLRAQALTRGVSDNGDVVDELDEEIGGEGRAIRLRTPTFPVCSVSPTPAPIGSIATVQVSGLLPSSPVHAVLGDEEVATGVTDATGAVALDFLIPSGSPVQPRLMTVGVDGTALTADCIVEVSPEPEITYQYAAKLVCGVQADTENMQLARGFYGTTINVYNPNRRPIRLVKRLALTVPPGQQKPGKTIIIAEDRLEPHQALATDCDDIVWRAFNGRMPTPYLEGFVVIEARQSLDVVAVYTTATLNAEGTAEDHSSIHVEPVRERVIEGRPAPDPEPEPPDLIVRDIDLDTLQVRCPQGHGSCVSTVDVTVENIGGGDAGPFTTKVAFDPSQSMTVERAFPAGLAALDAQTFTAKTMRGGNCYDPDCMICATADSDGDVAEANEGNNELCVERPG